MLKNNKIRIFLLCILSSCLYEMAEEPSPASKTRKEEEEPAQEIKQPSTMLTDPEQTQLAKETGRTLQQIKDLLAWNFTPDDIRKLHIKDIYNPIKEWDNWLRSAVATHYERGGTLLNSGFSMLMNPDYYFYYNNNVSEADFLILVPVLAAQQKTVLKPNPINDIARNYPTFHRFLLGIFGTSLPRAAAQIIGIAGFDPNVTDEDKNTALHVAVSTYNNSTKQYGYPNIVTLLLQLPNINVNSYNKVGLTPLHYAILFGDALTVSLLLENEAINVTQPITVEPYLVDKLNDHVKTLNIKTLTAKDILDKTASQLAEYIKNHDPNPTNKEIRTIIINMIKVKEKSQDPTVLKTEIAQLLAPTIKGMGPYIIPGAPADIINNPSSYRNSPAWNRPFAWIYDNPLITGQISALGTIAYFLLQHITTPPAIEDNLNAREFVVQLFKLLDSNKLYDAYTLAAYNQAAVKQLAPDQKQAIAQHIHKVRGEVIQAHKAAATSLPGLSHYRIWRLGNESDSLKYLTDLIGAMNP